MPQPRTKANIIKRLQTERDRLEQNVSYLSPDSLLRAGVVGQWSVKDILAHLADWEARMPIWMQEARSGDVVETPEPSLTWKQLDIVNWRIYEAHCHQSLEGVLEYFHTAHSRLMDLVQAMPDEEMLTCGRYAFTGQAAVYDWLVGFANHDLWGKTKIRQWAKAHGKLGKKSKLRERKSQTPKRAAIDQLVSEQGQSR